MNKKVQSYIWKAFGAAADIAFPVAYAGIKWGFIVESAAATKVSLGVVLAAIAALPALNQYQQKIKFNYIGIIIAGIGAAGYFIGEIMIQLGACIIAGSVSCSLCFWKANALTQQYRDDKLAANIVSQVGTARGGSK
jgi:hypothetical protein